jgi:hypothetical protein
MPSRQQGQTEMKKKAGLVKFGRTVTHSVFRVCRQGCSYLSCLHGIVTEFDTTSKAILGYLGNCEVMLHPSSAQLQLG